MSRTILVGLVACLLQNAALAGEPGKVELTGRVLFLGDSITHAGEYISILETRARVAGKKVEYINLGLPSETCSGLSEPKHPFPRPNVHERLSRALDKVKPDTVVVCYGMNDGIYYPLSDERFSAYRQGINLLISKIKASGARVVLCTPPAFDPLPMRKRGKLLPAGAKEYAWTNIYENYDKVMKAYADWILAQKERVSAVVDFHTPVNLELSRRRTKDLSYAMSNDGVHVNGDGHRVLADALSNGKKHDAPLPKKLHALVIKRQKLMHDAWLSHVGHKRPGVKAGLPLAAAQSAAAKIDKQIAALEGAESN